MLFRAFPNSQIARETSAGQTSGTLRLWLLVRALGHKSEPVPRSWRDRLGSDVLSRLVDGLSNVVLKSTGQGALRKVRCGFVEAGPWVSGAPMKPSPSFGCPALPLLNLGLVCPGEGGTGMHIAITYPSWSGVPCKAQALKITPSCYLPSRNGMQGGCYLAGCSW